MKTLASKILALGVGMFLVSAQGQIPRTLTKPTNSLLENFQALRKTNSPAGAMNAPKGAGQTVTISRTGIQPVVTPGSPPAAPISAATVLAPARATNPPAALLATVASKTAVPTNSPAAAPLASAVVTTNAPAQTNAIPAEAEDGDGSLGILAQLKAQEQEIRLQEKNPPPHEPAQTLELGTNELGDRLKDLEFTGEYVERFVRIPEGNNGKAKFIRFLVPVFRKK